MGKSEKIKLFREHIQNTYTRYPLACEDFGDFDVILCYEIHESLANPRMHTKTMNDGYCTGLTFNELAAKWGISVTFLGELIADHCRKLEKDYLP